MFKELTLKGLLKMSDLVKISSIYRRRHKKSKVSMRKKSAKENISKVF